MSSAVVFQAQSAMILGLILIGIYFRRTPSAHIRLMAMAITWDIMLILQIELSRGAIIKASQAVDNPAILNIHVSLALTTVILYAIMIYTGRKLLAKNWQLRTRHRLIGWSTLLLRTLVFITSFWAVE